MNPIYQTFTGQYIDLDKILMIGELDFTSMDETVSIPITMIGLVGPINVRLIDNASLRNIFDEYGFIDYSLTNSFTPKAIEFYGNEYSKLIDVVKKYKENPNIQEAETCHNKECIGCNLYYKELKFCMALNRKVEHMGKIYKGCAKDNGGSDE